MTTKVPPEYAIGFDFGFTAVDDPSAELPVQAVETRVEKIPEEVLGTLTDIVNSLSRIESRIAGNVNSLTRIEDQLAKPKSDEPVDVLQSRLADVEKLMMPLLVNLGKDPEKEYILWPNRTEQIDAQIEKLLKLTRG